jgi:hypothetical protein
MLALGGLAVPAAAPAVAEQCPNEAVREQQGSTRLPDCRAYEQVSPRDKNGGTIAAGLGARAEAGSVAFWSTSAFSRSASSVFANYRAQRTGEGWVTTALNPPTATRNPILMDQFYLMGLSADQSRALIETTYPVDPGDQGSGIVIDPSDTYRFEPDGSFTWLSQPPQLPDLSSGDAVFQAATDDLERVAFNSAKPLAPEFPDVTSKQVYVRAGDVTRLVSLGLDGRPLPDDAGIAGAGPGGSTAGSGSIVGGAYPTGLSDDGETVWFSDGTYAPERQLYVRVDALGPDAATRHVSRSVVTGDEGRNCQPQATFLVARRDGSRAWFGCASQLTDDAPAGGGLYSYDRDDDTVRYVPGTEGADNGLALAGADPHGDHVWFVTYARLSPDATGGMLNLYVLSGDEVDFVFTLGDTAVQEYDTAISPDGRWLAIPDSMPLDPRTNGYGQIYLADADDPAAGPVCISCRPGGGDSEGMADFSNAGLAPFTGPNAVRPAGALNDAGRVFFTSTDKLVPEDENGTADVYEYRDGELGLISTGRDPGGAVFAGASADATDVFLLTAEALTPQDDDNGIADVYSARVDGGFLASSEPPVCQKDCQGPADPPFTPNPPQSATFTGPGDVLDPIPPARATLRVAKLTTAQRRAWARSGRTTLTVRANRAGAVRATVTARIGRRAVRVATAARTLRRPGVAKLTVRLSKRARTQLARRGALKVTVTVRHARVSGTARAVLTLRAAAARNNGGKR